MTASVDRIVRAIESLTVDELNALRDILRRRWDEGGSGVREPRRPVRPLDAHGVALDSEKGKSDA